MENGLVLNFDVRTLPSNLELPSPSRFTLAAHDGPSSSIDVNPHLKGCIATGGTDKLVKVWNIHEDENEGKRSVSLVTSRDLGVVSRPTHIQLLKTDSTDVHLGRARCSRRYGHQTTH